DDPPTDAHEPTMPWQKEHVPNLTGTYAAYRPPGSILHGGKRARGTGDYEPWRPS
ncbi:MAG: NADH:ubiquinone oxidoreductase subunit NDUFA12, partial [Alphaproteobacteria bacterium]